jgi:CO/xanthine dehydrogenase Mo-binding subunit
MLIHPRSTSLSSAIPIFALNTLGARGVGEIGLAGIAAAITNAVHHATGFVYVLFLFESRDHFPL